MQSDPHITFDPFSRGFLLWPEAALPEKLAPLLVSLLEPWKSVRIGGSTLYFDGLSASEYLSRDGVDVALLGTVVDVTAPTRSRASIVAALADAIAADTHNGCADGRFPALAGALEALGGSHVVFFASGQNLWVGLDATGTFPACHTRHAGRTIVASHPTLLGAGLGLEISETARMWMAHEAVGAGGRYMPGLLTVIDGVENLVPNHFFALKDAQHHRFFPNADHTIRELDDIVDITAPLLAGQLETLAKTHSLKIGMSGGLDSRLTLAASRSIAPEADYFTYYSETNHILSNDITVANDLAKRFGLNHRSFKIWGTHKIDDTARKAWQLATGGMQGPPGTNSQFAAQFSQNDLHIRSNILETARGFYSKNPVNRGVDFDAHKLSRLFRRAVADEFTPHFAEFIEKTRFTNAHFRGYHYTDMFYWEHRLGAWLGPMIRANRLAMDTYIIYNCRLVLKTMMQLPMEQRNSAELVVALIQRLWPEVAEIPIFSGSKFMDLKRDMEA